MNTHYLKSWPDLFNAIIDGRKAHELRRCDDRSFNVGDMLILQEYDPKEELFTGRECKLEVTYITDYLRQCALSEQALQRNFCILSVRLI